MGFFVTSFEYNNKGRLDKIADLCLLPAHYLFGRRVIVIEEYAHRPYAEPINSHRYIERPFERAAWKTLLAVIVLIPTLIIGLIVKTAAWATSPTLRAFKTSSYEEPSQVIRHVGIVADCKNNPRYDAFVRQIGYRFPHATIGEEGERIFVLNGRTEGLDPSRTVLVSEQVRTRPSFTTERFVSLVK